MTTPVTEFYLDAHSGVSPYLRLDLLREGDQLPTVKEVEARLAINPNTALKAYRELEHEDLVAARPGLGTFVTATLPDASLPDASLPDASLPAHGPRARTCGTGWPGPAGPAWMRRASRSCS